MINLVEAHDQASSKWQPAAAAPADQLGPLLVAWQRAPGGWPEQHRGEPEAGAAVLLLGDRGTMAER
ncbi:MAG: hypothetical protein JXB15_15955 [Anaerolineales bacterium]|nr:hypothetical protein [Anaerolineales bacterium]